MPADEACLRAVSAMSSPPTSPPATAQRLRAYFWPQRHGLLAATGAFVLAAATEPLIPLLLRFVLDQGFVAQPGFPLWMVPVVLVGLFVMRGVLSFAGIYLLNRGTSRAVLALRRDLAGSLLRADAAAFSQVTPGVAVAKVIGDPQSVAGHLGGVMVTLLRDGTTALALLAYLLWENWLLTLLSLVTVPVLAVGVRVVQRRVQVVGRAGYEAQLSLAAVAEDLARAWRVIRSFGAEGFERARFDRQAQRLQSLTLKTAAANAMMTPVSQFASSLGVALIVTLALYQAQAGQATVGSFVAYVTGLLLLVSKTRHLTDLAHPFNAALIAARGVFELMDLPPETDTGTRTLGRARGEVVFEAVSLRYPGADRPAAPWRWWGPRVPARPRSCTRCWAWRHRSADRCCWTASGWASCARRTFGASSPWSRRTSCSSRARSPPTSSTPGTATRSGSRRACAQPRCGTTWPACRRAWRRRSASMAACCRADSASAWRSRARCTATPRCGSSTRPRPRSTPSPSAPSRRHWRPGRGSAP
jgi:ABC-type multidrug transport system fused ATPase/permease subunit